MPSAMHQWLALWAARRMVRDGFDPIAFDGPAHQAGLWNLLPRCPAIGAALHPDVVGLHRSGDIAIGEAKTAHDLRTTRSRRQLAVFAHLRHRASGDLVHLYVAVPSSVALDLHDLLAGLGLVSASHVRCVYVPDILLGTAA
jgi:hypothetical protein